VLAVLAMSPRLLLQPACLSLLLLAVCLWLLLRGGRVVHAGPVANLHAAEDAYVEALICEANLQAPGPAR